MPQLQVLSWSGGRAVMYLLSGRRFSTAVWVWLVVRMETCSPSGPLAVEMTSYSGDRGRVREEATETRASSGSDLQPRTCGVIVALLPVQDDEGRTSLHRHHRQVGGRSPGSRRHVGLTWFILWEVVEGGGDGAWLIWLLPSLVDDVRSCGAGGGGTSLQAELMVAAGSSPAVFTHPRNASFPEHQRPMRAEP